ncbi:MAG: DUF393 domain-containing protein [Cryobacterium sp.]|nr:DUF393 domain-containing protein [Oligoflexia bacterium]
MSVQSPPSPIIFYDGVCNLCNQSVQFILRRDVSTHFLFASLQGDYAKTRLARFGRAMEAEPDSVLLLEGALLSDYSTAALRIAGGMSFPWPGLKVFLLVPRPIRDGIYRFIARNRYRWFGKRDSCLLPKPEWRDRFLDPT